MKDVFGGKQMVGKSMYKVAGLSGFIAGLLISQIASAITLQYSDKVPMDQQQLLNADLESLQTLVPIDADGELKRILKLKAVSPTQMNKWLAERVHFVVEESFEPGENNLTIEAQNAKYPNSGADVSLQAIADQKDQKDQRAEEKEKVQVVMSNLGGSIYGFGKSHKIVVGAVLSGLGVLTISSPRVGLLQVGEALFQPLDSSWPIEVIKNGMHSLRRITTLFHEARHSDGRGPSLTFSHTYCPPGHGYAGKPACDLMANGAYRISVLVLKAYTNSCRGCSDKEKDVLRMLTADHMTRILVPIEHTVQVNDLCRLAESKGPKPAFCNKKEIRSQYELDDTPEGVKIEKK